MTGDEVACYRQTVVVRVPNAKILDGIVYAPDSVWEIILGSRTVGVVWDKADAATITRAVNEYNIALKDAEFVRARSGR